MFQTNNKHQLTHISLFFLFIACCLTLEELFSVTKEENTKQLMTGLEHTQFNQKQNTFNSQQPKPIPIQQRLLQQQISLPTPSKPQNTILSKSPNHLLTQHDQDSQFSSIQQQAYDGLDINQPNTKQIQDQPSNNQKYLLKNYPDPYNLQKHPKIFNNQNQQKSITQEQDDLNSIEKKLQEIEERRKKLQQRKQTYLQQKSHSSLSQSQNKPSLNSETNQSNLKQNLEPDANEKKMQEKPSPKSQEFNKQTREINRSEQSLLNLQNQENSLRFERDSQKLRYQSANTELKQEFQEIQTQVKIQKQILLQEQRTSGKGDDKLLEADDNANKNTPNDQPINKNLSQEPTNKKGSTVQDSNKQLADHKRSNHQNNQDSSNNSAHQVHQQKNNSKQNLIAQIKTFDKLKASNDLTETDNVKNIQTKTNNPYNPKTNQLKTNGQTIKDKVQQYGLNSNPQVQQTIPSQILNDQTQPAIQNIQKLDSNQEQISSRHYQSQSVQIQPKTQSIKQAQMNQRSIQKQSQQPTQKQKEIKKNKDEIQQAELGIKFKQENSQKDTKGDNSKVSVDSENQSTEKNTDDKTQDAEGEKSETINQYQNQIAEQDKQSKGKIGSQIKIKNEDNPSKQSLQDLKDSTSIGSADSQTNQNTVKQDQLKADPSESNTNTKEIEQPKTTEIDQAKTTNKQIGNIQTRINQKLGNRQPSIDTELNQRLGNLQAKLNQITSLISKQKFDPSLPKEHTDTLKISNLQIKIEELDAKLTQIQNNLLKQNTHSQVQSLQNKSDLLTPRIQKLENSVIQLQTAHSLQTNNMMKYALNQELNHTITRITQLQKKIDFLQSFEKNRQIIKTQKHDPIQPSNSIQPLDPILPSDPILPADTQTLQNSKALKNPQTEIIKQASQQNSNLEGITDIKGSKQEKDPKKQQKQKDKLKKPSDSKDKNQLAAHEVDDEEDKITATNQSQQKLASQNQNQKDQTNQFEQQNQNQKSSENFSQQEQGNLQKTRAKKINGLVKDQNNLSIQQQQDLDDEENQRQQTAIQAQKTTKTFLFGFTLGQVLFSTCSFIIVAISLKKIFKPTQTSSQRSSLQGGFQQKSFVNFGKQQNSKTADKIKSKRYDPDNEDDLPSQRRIVKDEINLNQSYIQMNSISHKDRENPKISIVQLNTFKIYDDTSLQRKLNYQNSKQKQIQFTKDENIILSRLTQEKKQKRFPEINTSQLILSQPIRSIKPLKKPTNQALLQQFEKTKIPNSFQNFDFSMNHQLNDQKIITNKDNSVTKSTKTQVQKQESEDEEFEQYSDGNSIKIPFQADLGTQLAGLGEQIENKNEISTNNQDKFAAGVIQNQVSIQTIRTNKKSQQEKQDDQFEDFQQYESPQQKGESQQQDAQIQTQKTQAILFINSDFQNEPVILLGRNDATVSKSIVSEQKQTLDLGSDSNRLQKQQNNDTNAISTQNNQDDPFSNLI